MGDIAKRSIGLPSELPEKPEEWKRQMVCHMSLQGGGAGSFNVFDDKGAEMPIGYMYNDVDKVRGFTLPHVDEVMSWARLREIWPEWVKSHGRDFAEAAADAVSQHHSEE